VHVSRRRRPVYDDGLVVMAATIERGEELFER
jgi:hypothetical protein